MNDLTPQGAAINLLRPDLPPNPLPKREGEQRLRRWGRYGLMVVTVDDYSVTSLACHGVTWLLGRCRWRSRLVGKEGEG